MTDGLIRKIFRVTFRFFLSIGLLTSQSLAAPKKKLDDEVGKVKERGAPSILFQIPDNIIVADVNEAEIRRRWETPSLLSAVVRQTAYVQFEILKGLSLRHGLSLLFPWSSEGGGSDGPWNIVRSGLKNSPKNRQALAEMWNARMPLLEGYLSRILQPESHVVTFWGRPQYIQFQDSSLMARADMHLVCPIFCGKFLTHPPLGEGKNYLFSEFDFEDGSLQSRLAQTYVKNLALSLQSLKEKSPSIVGASLLLRGRVPRELLKWLRGTSPLDPSPVSEVEILYAVPLLEKFHKKLVFCKGDKTLHPQEYWFSLKHGGGVRLKKANSLVGGQHAKEVNEMWGQIQSYVVVDEVIRDASDFSKDFSKERSFSEYVQKFWRLLGEIKKPVRRQIPVSGNIAQQLEAYKAHVEKELSSMRQKGANDVEVKKGANDVGVKKAEKLLEALSKIDMDQLKLRVEAVAGSVVRDKTLYYLDPSHVFYDFAKNKNYSKTDWPLLSSLTDSLLDEEIHKKSGKGDVKENKKSGGEGYEEFVGQMLHRDPCFIKVSGSSPMKISISTIPEVIPSNDITFSSHGDALVGYTLMNMLLLTAQLSLTAEEIHSLWSQIGEREFARREQKHFRKFLSFYKEYNGEIKVKAESKAKSKGAKEGEANKAPKGGELRALLEELYEAPKTMPGVFAQDNVRLFMEEIEKWINQLDSDRSTRRKEAGNIMLREEAAIGEDDGDAPQKSCPPELKKKGEQESLDDFIRFVESIPLSRGGVSQQDAQRDFSFGFLKSLLPLADENSRPIPSEGWFADALRSVGLLPQSGKNVSLHFWNVFSEKSNLVKFIYVIDEHGEVRVAPENLYLENDSKRPTHSELANGRGVQAAGELIFRKDRDRWRLILINNGSGHYRPPALETLPIAKELILKKLDSSILTDTVRTLNCLRPGMAMASGWDDLEAWSYVDRPSHAADSDFSRVLQESLKEARAQGQVGPREIEGFHLQDVNDVGNCFYEAVVDQMQQLNHEFIQDIPVGTSPHDLLRLRIQGEAFADRQWADDRIFDQLVRLFPNIILAVIDTRAPEQGFTTYYLDVDGSVITDTGYMGLSMPQNRLVIRVAATGNHFLSVRRHPALAAGAIRDQVWNPSPLYQMYRGQSFINLFFPSNGEEERHIGSWFPYEGDFSYGEREGFSITYRRAFQLLSMMLFLMPEFIKNSKVAP